MADVVHEWIAIGPDLGAMAVEIEGEVEVGIGRETLRPAMAEIMDERRDAARPNRRRAGTRRDRRSRSACSRPARRGGCSAPADLSSGRDAPR